MSQMSSIARTRTVSEAGQMGRVGMVRRAGGREKVSREKKETEMDIGRSSVKTKEVAAQEDGETDPSGAEASRAETATASWTSALRRLSRLESERDDRARSRSSSAGDRSSSRPAGDQCPDTTTAQCEILTRRQTQSQAQQASPPKPKLKPKPSSAPDPTPPSPSSANDCNHMRPLSQPPPLPQHSRLLTRPFPSRLLSSVLSFNPTCLTISIPSSILPSPMATPTSHPRWFSPQFLCYWLILAYSIKQMVLAAFSLSQESHPNYPSYKHKLSPGWIFGRKIDNSDSQYRRFRLGIPKLTLLALGYLLLASLTRHGRLPRAHFQSLAAGLILCALHGTSVLKILAIITLNFWIARLNGGRGRAAVAAVWAFNVAVLFANDYWDGYRFRHIAAPLGFLDNGAYRGLIPRWQIGFNISMLRLISYGLDYQWAAKSGFASDPNVPEADIEKERASRNRTEAEYGFQNYFNYVFYPPLYIAGPIITFNNFMSQMVRRPLTITNNMVVRYAVRFGVCFLTLETILHSFYMVAIKDARAWQGDTPFELGMVGYWNLIIIWLKLLIPWRFFRLWALLDGVDAPENMVRCMSNNFSTLEFWRSWHRSYNLWIVRYLYIPIGGSANMVPATVLVFTFVALWHDLSFRLLTWGWLVSVFVVPEVVAKKIVARSKIKDRDWFRNLKAIGGTFNVMTMMSANLVGFSLGVDGVKVMWNGFLGSWHGIKVFMVILGVVYCAVQVMIEYREAEVRQGICRKC